jgi:hypothetical protein
MGPVAAVIGVALYRAPVCNEISADEIAYLDARQGAEAVSTTNFASWRALFRHRAAWGMLFGFQDRST